MARVRGPISNLLLTRGLLEQAKILVEQRSAEIETLSAMHSRLLKTSPSYPPVCDDSGRKSTREKLEEYLRLNSAPVSYSELGLLLGVTAQRIGQLMTGQSAANVKAKAVSPISICHDCHMWFQGNSLRCASCTTLSPEPLRLVCPICSKSRTVRRSAARHYKSAVCQACWRAMRSDVAVSLGLRPRGARRKPIIAPRVNLPAVVWRSGAERVPHSQT